MVTRLGLSGNDIIFPTPSPCSIKGTIMARHSKSANKKDHFQRNRARLEIHSQQLPLTRQDHGVHKVGACSTELKDN